MHDALNELKSYATTLDFGLQSGWGSLRWKLILVSPKCNQFVSEWWRKVVLCSGSAINVCKGVSGWVVRKGDQAATWLRAAGAVPR